MVPGHIEHLLMTVLVRAVLTSLRIALLSEIVWYSIIIDVDFLGVELW